MYMGRGMTTKTRIRPRLLFISAFAICSALAVPLGAHAQWLHDVPGASDVPVAPGTSPTSWYTTPENVEHIAYVGTDQRIHELFFFVGPNGHWLHYVPGDVSDVPVAPG